MQGICRLCLEEAGLKESHVWSKFLYKDYVADLSRGGEVIPVFLNGDEEKRQVVRYWLCQACEQKLGTAETYVRQLFQRIDKARDRPHNYDGRLLRFAASIAWRSLMLMREGWNRGLLEDAYPAAKCWRQFLKGDRHDVGCYTLHAFVIFDDASGSHRILGCVTADDESLIVAQAGPLLIVGRLRSVPLSNQDRKTWRQSKLSNGAGVIAVVKEWRVGVNLTRGLLEVLAANWNLMVHAIHKSYESTPTGFRRRHPRRLK